MKRMRLLLVVVLMAAGVLSGCIVVPVEGPHYHRGWYRPYYHPYPYYPPWYYRGW